MHNVRLVAVVPEEDGALAGADAEPQFQVSRPTAGQYANHGVAANQGIHIPLETRADARVVQHIEKLPGVHAVGNVPLETVPGNTLFPEVVHLVTGASKDFQHLGVNLVAPGTGYVNFH